MRRVARRAAWVWCWAWAAADSEEAAVAFFESVVRSAVIVPTNSHESNHSRGVVYAAIGASTLRKATASALSVRATKNAVGILAVVSDLSSCGSPMDYCASLEGHGLSFDGPEVRAFTPTTQRFRKKSDSWSLVRRLRTAKIAALALALRLFPEALFLDADTAVCASLEAAFAPLRRHDVAFVPAPSTHHAALLERTYGLRRQDEPPEPNSGVFAYTRRAAPLFKRWLEVYWRESLALGPLQNPMDQPPLRVALFQLLPHTRFFRFLPSFNCRGHARHLNLALPLTCDGNSAFLFDVLRRDLTPHQTQLLKKALSELSTQRDCLVLHSHALPRPAPPCPPHCPSPRTPNLFLQTPQTMPKDVAVVGCRAANVVVDNGAVVLVVAEPSQRSVPLLDELSPLWHFESLAERHRRIGPPTVADLAAVLDRLEKDFALVLLASKPEASLALLAAAFPDRPDVHRAVRAALQECPADESSSFRRRVDNATRRLDAELYRACERLFATQRDRAAS